MVKIYQKWGFGMAPVKPATQDHRCHSAKLLLTTLDSTETKFPSKDSFEVIPEAISEIKGLFTRSYKQDQWDWFTVWMQLGRPGRQRCRDISSTLRNLRQSLLSQNVNDFTSNRLTLIQLRAASALRAFLSLQPEATDSGSSIGYIYILSTRTNPTMLKIGYTERTVEQRVKEINRATGILEPYGVRALWVVQNAPLAEKTIHNALAEYRVRADREFFELSYQIAFRVVGNIVRSSRQEI